MPIVVRLDRVMAERKVTSAEVASLVGITPVNLSRLKTGKVHGVRFETLEALCKVLRCQPGDLFEYMTPEELEEETRLGAKP